MIKLDLTKNEIKALKEAAETTLETFTTFDSTHIPQDLISAFEKLIEADLS
jgi:hypothetical protein